MVRLKDDVLFLPFGEYILGHLVFGDVVILVRSLCYPSILLLLSVPLLLARDLLQPVKLLSV